MFLDFKVKGDNKQSTKKTKITENALFNLKKACNSLSICSAY